MAQNSHDKVPVTFDCCECEKEASCACFLIFFFYSTCAFCYKEIDCSLLGFFTHGMGIKNCETLVLCITVLLNEKVNVQCNLFYNDVS